MRRKVNILAYTAVCYSLLLFVYLRLQNSFQPVNTSLEFQKQIPNLSEETGYDVARASDVHLNAKRHLAETLSATAEMVLASSCEISPIAKDSCAMLVNGDARIIQNMTNIYKAEKRSKPQCTADVKSCDEFMHEHKYYQIPITEEEVDFPLAFAIKIHDELEQTLRLLRTIYRPNNAYCIHVDKNAPHEVFQVINKVGECFTNVIILQDRQALVHASASNVKAELKCMNALLASNVKWKYYMNVAPSEFPLRTNFEMVAILRLINNANDIETYDNPVFLDWRVDHGFTVEGNGVAEDVKKTPLKDNIKISKGNAYGLFSKDFVNFITTDTTAKYVIEWFNNTYMPEENVWATLVTLPEAPGGYKMEVRHMTKTFMSRALVISGDQQRCYGKFDDSVCVLGFGDIPWVTKRPEFFAHKFDSNSGVLDCIEQWYREKAMDVSNGHIDWKFYLNLRHLKEKRKL